MNKLLLSMMALACLTSACVTKPVALTPVNSASIDSPLLAVANEIKQEMKRIIQLDSTAGRASAASAQEGRMPGNLSAIVSIDFDDDILLFLKDLQSSGIINVDIVGRRPPRDVIVSLHHHKVPLHRVLEDAGIQIGKLGVIEASSTSIRLKWE